MNFARLSQLLIAATLAATAATGCDAPFGADDTEDSAVDRAALRALIVGIDAPELPMAQSNETDVGEETLVSHDMLLECNEKSHSATEIYEDLIVLDPTADALWPGAIVQTKSFVQGIPAPIGLARKSGKITISGVTLTGDGAESGSGRMVAEPSMHAVQDAIADILRSADVHAAANLESKIESVRSLDEAAKALSVNVDWFKTELRADFESDLKAFQTTMLVSFVQRHYSVSFAAPPQPEEVFADSVGVVDAEPYMGPDNPPAYVSDVTYGRRLMVMVSSNETVDSVRAAIEATVGNGNLTVEAEKTHKRVLAESSIRVFVSGGDATAATLIQSSSDPFEAIADYVAKGANIDTTAPSVPLGYTLRRLADNQAVKVASTTEFAVLDCSADDEVWVRVSHVYLRNNGVGKFAAKPDLHYSIVARYGSQEHVIATGTFAKVSDGEDYTFGAEALVPFRREHGAALTVEGTFEVDGQVAVPNETHHYYVDSNALTGSFSNPTVAKDAGSGKLDLRLHYSVGQ